MARNKDDGQETQSVDPIFGQVRAFSFEDSSVDPAVRKYLMEVREEALKTSCVGASLHRRTTTRFRMVKSFDMYDEAPPISPELLLFDKHQTTWFPWFKQAKNILHSQHWTLEQSLNTETMDIALQKVKKFLVSMKHDSDSDTDLRLEPLRIALKDIPLYEEPLQMADQSWFKRFLDNMANRPPENNLSKLKVHLFKCRPVPRNFNAWYHYVTHNDATRQDMERFSADQIFRVASYMTAWATDIAKDKNAQRLSQWILYVLLYLPDHMTAQEISVLREWAKKARQLKLKSLQPKERTNLQNLVLPSDMFAIEGPPLDLSAIDLTLTVIGNLYGQTDLLQWS
ncbi:LAMI_0E09802g1_1 [Lachancea mirantina]|uniref:LAMI_0E09802g1_1 n=1 Tax=Lachancea mirantina TaxID=1230905 RepID=A0A1G4JNP9_9SACH|nr:LAMI_0E09802g1_1 [Lachancea mirantina]